MSLQGIAETTLGFLDAGGFQGPAGAWIDFKEPLADAVAGTRLYTPDQLAELVSELGQPSGQGPEIMVSGDTTQVAAHALVTERGLSDLVLLNFASARNPGGGFISGAKAQEEDLTRCSGLYPCLLTQPTYYEVNREQSSMLYTDHMIYSPKVPWFRTRSTDLLDTFFTASVITALAPNAGEALRRDPQAGPDIEACLRRRAARVLAVARHQGHRHLLLGAWGCGVFRNDPSMVADAFGTALESTAFADAFDSVTFAVLDRSKSGATRAAFEARFVKNPRLDS